MGGVVLRSGSCDMKCPVCGKQMVEKDFGPARVDVCENGCKGMWFDWTELRQLDEKNEGMGLALQEALRSNRANDTDRGPLNCPKCGLPMHSHKYSNAKEVNVDECYACGGFFLDSGELKEIRENFMSEQERDAYVQKLCEQVPGFKDLEKQAEKNRTRNESCSVLGGTLRQWVFGPVLYGHRAGRAGTEK